MDALHIQRGDYLLSTDPSLLQLDRIHEFLSTQSYWAKGRSLETVRLSVANSLCFGIYRANSQVGFARVVTDFATFAWLCDVFILPEECGHGLGKWLVENVTSHPALKTIRRMLLATRDAHELYHPYGGFQPLANPERWMERFNPDA